jgi:hypothetical protein
MVPVARKGVLRSFNYSGSQHREEHRDAHRQTGRGVLLQDAEGPGVLCQVGLELNGLDEKNFSDLEPFSLDQLFTGNLTTNSESVMRRAVSVGRDQLMSLGTCFGKFTKTGKFTLSVTSLDYLARYAKVRLD